MTKNILSLSSLVVSRASGALSMLLLTLFITRTEDPESAGLTLLAISLVIVLGQIGAAGGHQAAIKATGQSINAGDWNSVNQNLSGLIRRTLAFLALLPFFVVALTSAQENYPVSLVICIGVAAAAFSLTQVFAGAFIGVGRANLGTFLLNGSTSSICLILLGSAYAVGFDSRELSLMLFTLAAVATMLTSMWTWQAQAGAQWSTAPLRNDIYNLARASHPSVIFQLSTQYAAQFTVAAMLSTAQVAEFTTALRVALLIAFVLMAANLMIAGQLADLHAKKDIEGINRLTKQTSQLLLAFSIPLLLIIWWGARNVMGLFGAAYESSAIILQILAIGQFINVLTGPTSMILTMCGGEFDQRRVLFITFIVSTLAAIVLTYLYGLLGAAIATALGVSSQNLMAAYYVHKRLGFNVLNPFRKVE